MKFTTLIKGISTVALASMIPTITWAETWTVNRVVNDTSVSVGQGQLAVNPSGGFLLAYPQGSPGSSAGDQRIYAITSTDGYSWSSPATVRDVPGTNTYCSAAYLPDGRSVVAWHRKRASESAYDVWAALEDSAGAGTWTTEQITDDSNDDKRVRVATYSDNTYAVVFPRQMPAGSSGDKDIAFASKSESVWGIEMLTDNTLGDHRPVMTVDYTGVTHVVYPGYRGTEAGAPTDTDWELFYTNNSGGTWSAAINLSTELTLPSKADWPAMCIDTSGNIHIAVAAGDSANAQDREVYYITNSSGSWQSEMISTGHTEPCEWVVMDMTADGSVHVAYQVGRIFKQSGSIPTSVWYIKSDTSGNFGTPEEIEDSWSDSEKPTIAVDSGQVIVGYNAKISGSDQLIIASYNTSSSLTDWNLY